METWRITGYTSQLASFLATEFVDFVTIWMLLEMTGEIYNIMIYDLSGFFEKALKSHVFKVAMYHPHGRTFVTEVIEWRNRNLLPLKTRQIEGLTHVKSVEAQIPPVGMVWKLEEGVPDQSTSQNYGVRHQ
ncbi:hypothetical protein TNCV_4044231 [Trichonephila clavipes]|nr:hypothetical protein TNCV_4044231 [Trichonephila clavipes]